MMMQRKYPIIEQRQLRLPERQGPLGLGRRCRDREDLPEVLAHHLLVYRVRGEYVVDNGRLGLDDERVVEADHVSLVDVGRDTAVSVPLTIPSGEDAPFTIVTTFNCTVTDAVTVVREGQTEAAKRLDTYLRAHQRLFELGQYCELAEVNEVRVSTSAQIQAYTQLKPPVIPGISIELAGVEVTVPDALREYREKLRETREQYDLSNHVAIQEGTQALKEDHLKQALAAQQQNGTLERAQQVDEFAKESPARVWAAGLASGEFSYADLAAQLDKRERMVVERIEREQEELRRRWEVTREDELRRQTWRREDERQQLALKLELIKEALQRGHGDEVSLGLDELIRQMLEPGVSVASGGEERQSIEKNGHDFDGEAAEEEDSGD